MFWNWNNFPNLPVRRGGESRAPTTMTSPSNINLRQNNCVLHCTVKRASPVVHCNGTFPLLWIKSIYIQANYLLCSLAGLSKTISACIFDCSCAVFIVGAGNSSILTLAAHKAREKETFAKHFLIKSKTNGIESRSGQTEKI